MPYLVGQREVFMEGENRDDFIVTNLPTGQVQDFNAIRAFCKAKGILYEDPTFPASPESIGPLKYVTETKGAEGASIVWKRPREVNPKFIFCQVDPKTKKSLVERSDIKQGSLGDCYIIAAIGILLGEEKLAEFIIPPDNSEDNSAGIYHFRFWINGFFYDIVVDDLLPYKQMKNGKYHSIFARSTTNEIWPMLIEKAYAKIHGSYAKIGSGGWIGETLQEISGGHIQETKFKGHQSEFKWEDLRPSSKHGVLTGLATSKGAPCGLVSMHCFAVVDKTVVKNKAGEETRLIRVRNPWGRKEWTGDWSDKSSLWDTLPAEDKELLDKDLDDGEFWISFADATNPDIFSAIHICYWLKDLDKVVDPKKHLWQWHDIHNSWKGPGAGDHVTAESLVKKPQYLVKIDSQGKPHHKVLLMFSLLHKDYLNKEYKKPKVMNFNFYHVKDKTLVNLPLPATAFKDPEKLELLKPDTDRFSRERSTSGWFLPGTYLIVPYMTPKVEARFLLRIICENKFTTTSAIANACTRSDPPIKNQADNELGHYVYSSEVAKDSWQNLPYYDDMPPGNYDYL